MRSSTTGFAFKVAPNSHQKVNQTSQPTQHYLFRPLFQGKRAKTAVYRPRTTTMRQQRLVSAKATAAPGTTTSISAPSVPPADAPAALPPATALVQALRAQRPPALLWARLTGFPHWPARFCSPHEEATLRLKKAPSSSTQVDSHLPFQALRCAS